MTDTNGTKYYLHYDQVGSLRAVSNENGDVVKEIVYDTFGNIISDSNETLKVPFGFAGGLYDRDTKLIHFGFREYDPFTGRWTAKDPILFAGGDSLYIGYVGVIPVELAVDALGVKLEIYCNLTFTALFPKEFIGKLAFEKARNFFGLFFLGFIFHIPGINRNQKGQRANQGFKAELLVQKGRRIKVHWNPGFTKEFPIPREACLNFLKDFIGKEG